MVTPQHKVVPVFPRPNTNNRNTTIIGSQFAALDRNVKQRARYLWLQHHITPTTQDVDRPGCTRLNQGAVEVGGAGNAHQTTGLCPEPKRIEFRQVTVCNHGINCPQPIIA